VKLSRLTIALYVGLIFVSGVVLGVFGHSLYAVTVVKSNNPKPEDVRKKTLAEMQSRMKLTDEQVSKINSIYDETRARVHEVRERHKPEMDAITNDQREKVRAILSPDQVSEYERMLKERDEHKEREEHQKQNGVRGSGPGI
jgi:Spy/CpxP family protein refolding chaperone